jgi:hydrophobic/amphiphilic exporter-1 (mainly G- bacteria), HAE1 family
MIAIAAAVFGFVSYQRLPLNLMPDLSYPTVTVRTEVEGYAPQEVESQISRPIEEALATTQGLAELESRSRAGISDVILEFAWGTDMDAATQSVRERLQTTFLPPDAQRPLILRYDPTQEPILRLALSIDPERIEGDRLDGDKALYLLRDVAERDIKRSLEAMDGVAAVRVRGGLEKEVLVEAREDWLNARGVTLEQLSQTLGAENVNLPGGAIRDGDHEYLVRTLNEVRTVDEIARLEIRRQDGTRVPVSQVATVREAHKDREVVTRLDGRDAVELEIYKAADANIVRISEALDVALHGRVTGGGPEGGPQSVVREGGISERLPDGVILVELEDQARFITAAINNLRSTAMLGALLAVIVLFAFLRDFRATAIIAAAIPLSIIVTFAPLYMGSVSLNLMSLGGLALGIGMLVDNAVVVLESIQVQLDKGLSRDEAAVKGTQDVAAAVIASTLTTVSVFLPIAFVEGVAGQIFGDLATAVVSSLLASLAVALLFVPMLAARTVSLGGGDRPLLSQLRAHARFPRATAAWEAGWTGSWVRRILRLPLTILQAAWALLADLESARLIGASWRTRGWGGRLIRMPWWLARSLLIVVLEVPVNAFIFGAAIVARPVAGIFAVVLAVLARGAMFLADGFQRIYQPLADRYAASMGGILRRPGLVLGIVALLTAAAAPIGANLGQALIPELHQGRFTVELALPVGTTLARTADRVAAAERALEGTPGIAHAHSIIGTEKLADSRSDEGEHTARVMIAMTPGGDLEARETALMDEVRRRIRTSEAENDDGLPPAEMRLTRPSLFSFSTPIEVVLYDTDLERLRDVSDRVTEVIATVPGLTDVRSSLTAGYPEVRVRYDRVLLQRYGLDTGTIARQVRDKVLGSAATTLSRGDGRVDLRVRVDESDRRGLANLRRLNINPAVTPAIPLETVATFVEAEGPSEIRRIDQQRAVSITANLEGFDISGQAADIRAAMAGLAMEGVEWEIAGQNREMTRSINSLLLALGLAVFLVYVIMASTFESTLHPFVILFSVPLALIGVVAALWLSDTPVSVVVFIGAIVLAGVVVNNAIVLVDTINRLRQRGMERVEAIHEGARLRLRPILITTLTTVLGLLPLSIGLGEGAEVQQPLALTIIAGLTSSTLLTLVVIPVVYQALTRLLERRPEATE